MGVFPPMFGVQERVPDIREYYTLFNLVERTSWRIGRASTYRPETNFPRTGDDLKTEFGRYALSLVDLPTRTYSPMGLCSQAEPSFVHAMHQDEIDDDERFSPIIVTRADEPVGILKPVGEMSYYALEQDVPSRTHPGHMYWTLLDKHRAFDRNLAAPHAWNIPLDEVQGAFRNGRLSTFLIPSEERQTLKRGYGEDISLLRQSHDGFRVAAALALENSVRIHPEQS